MSRIPLMRMSTRISSSTPAVLNIALQKPAHVDLCSMFPDGAWLRRRLDGWAKHKIGEQSLKGEGRLRTGLRLSSGQKLRLGLRRRLAADPLGICSSFLSLATK